MRRTNSYTVRAGIPRSEIRSVFVACEGYKTEINYMNTLSESSEFLGMDPRINLVVLNRFSDERGLSDPDRVLDIALDFLEWVKHKRLSVHLFTGAVLNNANLDRWDGYREELTDALISSDATDEEGMVTDLDEARAIAADVLMRMGVGVVTMELPDYLFGDGDTVFLVVDRDKSPARNTEKYHGFLDRCNGSEIRPIVTNPKFELWMLLHFEDSCDSLGLIVESKNPSKTVMRELGKRTIPKKDYDFSGLIFNLDIAMRNSESLEHDPYVLESSVGTNMPELIRHLRGEDSKQGRTSAIGVTST